MYVVILEPDGIAPYACTTVFATRAEADAFVAEHKLAGRSYKDGQRPYAIIGGAS